MAFYGSSTGESAVKQLVDQVLKCRSGTVNVLLVVGTRPEAVKLAPLITYLKSRPADFRTHTCVTAQHREMLDEVLAAFRVTPDYDLNVMRPGQTLLGTTSSIVAGLESVLSLENPDLIIVQGDTTTTFCGALAGFYRQVPVGHVEAGLRTGDIHRPFPEEMNRVMTTKLSSLHFAPTKCAADNLRAEGVASSSIFVTGNTGIDALLQVRDALDQRLLAERTWSWLDARKKLILVTAHRRESFGQGFNDVCTALTRLASRSDVQIAFPVHPNPNIREPVYLSLASTKNIYLLEPIEYVSFIDLMRRAYLVLTDSGGIQEEAPSLGKPVLLLRRETERPEAVVAGTTRLVGSSEDDIVRQVSRLLDDNDEYASLTRSHNPYGDGHASERIAEIILSARRL